MFAVSVHVRSYSSFFRPPFNNILVLQKYSLSILFITFAFLKGFHSCCLPSDYQFIYGILCIHCSSFPVFVFSRCLTAIPFVAIFSALHCQSFNVCQSVICQSVTLSTVLPKILFRFCCVSTNFSQPFKLWVTIIFLIGYLIQPHGVCDCHCCLFHSICS